MKSFRHLTRAPKINQRVAAVAVVLTLVLSFAAGSIRILDAALGANTWKWVHDPRAFGYPAIALLVVTFLDALRRLKWGRQAKLIASQKREIRKQLSSLVATLSEVLDCLPGLIGCGLFLVDNRRTWQSPIHGRRIRRPWKIESSLIRVERVRLLDNSPESTVHFTKGKGVVGRCWEREDTAYFDWRTINVRHHEKDSWRPRKGSPGWNGFSEAEWLQMVGRYSAVLAVPVTKSRKFVGCVAVDYRWLDGAEDDKSPKLNGPEAKHSVGGIARTLVGVLYGGEG